MTLIVLTVIGVLAIALVTSVALIVHDLATEPPQQSRHVEPTRRRHLEPQRARQFGPAGARHQPVPSSSFEPTLVGR